MHFFIQHEKNISTNHMMGIFYTKHTPKVVVVRVKSVGSNQKLAGKSLA